MSLVELEDGQIGGGVQGAGAGAGSTGTGTGTGNIYVLDDDDEDNNDGNFGKTSHFEDIESSLRVDNVLIGAVNDMSTNYAVAAIFLVCCVVTLVFAAVRLYMFPFKLGKDNKTNAPEAKLFRTLTSRSLGWMEMSWSIATSLRAIFDDVCVFVTALVLTLAIVA